MDLNYAVSFFLIQLKKKFVRKHYSSKMFLFKILISFEIYYLILVVLLTTIKLKGAKAPIIAFENKNNNSGQYSTSLSISLSLSLSLCLSLSLSLSLSLFLFLPLSLTLSLSHTLTGEEGVRTPALSACACHKPGNTKGGSITVPLTSCLTGLDQPVLQIKTKIVSCHSAYFKPVKQEVNCTMILPLQYSMHKHSLFSQSVNQHA